MLRDLREADIALTEIANGKLTLESTFGQNGTAEPPARIVLFPDVDVAKKAVGRKKRRNPLSVAAASLPATC